MSDEIIYGLVFLLMGLITLLWSKNATKSKGDPFLIKIIFIGGGIFCFLVAIYLFIKSF